LSTFDNVVDSFARLDPRLMLVALGFHLANFGFRSLGWRNVLRAAYPERRVPLLGIAGAYAAGVAVNSFTPARGGDVVKVALVRTRIRGSSVPTIASSMGVLTLLDALVGAVVLGLLAVSGQLPRPPALPGLPGPVAIAVAHPFATAAALVVVGGVAVVVTRRFAARLARIWAELRAGAAILASPRRYLTEVVPFQLSAWASRVGAAYFLLAAFHVPATVSAAVIVVMVGGLSTVVPTPGGLGTQQVLLAYLLHTTASTATLVSFSLGMQAAVTTVNTLVGLTAAMLMLRTLRPASAIRAHVLQQRGER
jgi:uncharacterized membrane protein YbhN (UPF0104 family)